MTDAWNNTAATAPPLAPSGSWAWTYIRHRAWTVTAVVAALFAAPIVHAAVFPDLYTVTVEADASAARSPATAGRTGLEALLTRVTGRRGKFEPGQLERLGRDAGRLVSSYGWVDEGELRVGFTPGAVAAELEGLGWPLWHASRPLTLIWIAAELESGERAVLSATPAPGTRSAQMAAFLDEIEQELKTTANKRGLPITLPLWDLEDRSLISFAELWGGFDEQILDASRRYGADAVLVGRIERTRFGRSSRWTLLREDGSRAVVARGAAEGIHWLADLFAAQYSTSGDSRNYRLTVSGVRSFSDYGRVMRVLGSVGALEAVNVQALEEDVLTIRVRAQGDSAMLERLLTLGDLLTIAPRTIARERVVGDALALRVSSGGKD